VVIVLLSVAPSPPKRYVLRALLALVVVAGLGTLVLFLRDRGPVVVEPPPPEGAADAEADTLPLSTLALSVRYDLDRLRSDLDAAIPRRFGDLSKRHPHPSNPRLSFAGEVEREGLGLTLLEGELHVTLPFAYRAQVWLEVPFLGEVSAGCGLGDRGERGDDRAEPGDGEAEARRGGAGTAPGEGGTRGEQAGAEGRRADGVPRARVRLATPVTITRGWGLRTDVRVVDVEPASDRPEDRCRVTAPPLSLDATEVLLETVEGELQNRVAEVDSLVARLDLRTALEGAWRRLREPVALAENTWLVVDPRGARIAPLEAAGGAEEAIEARASLLARPRIALGARPEPRGAALGRAEAWEDDVERFDLWVEGGVSYDAASRRLEGELVGEELTVAGRRLRVAGVKVRHGGGRKVAVELDVEGGVQGRLFLVGTPVFDAAEQVLTVPDLTFSAETRNLLEASAVWLLRSVFPERVRRLARWDAGESLDRARAVAEDGLDRTLAPGVELEGTLGRLSVEDVAAGREGIRIRARLAGTARLRIAPP